MWAGRACFLSALGRRRWGQSPPPALAVLQSWRRLLNVSMTRSAGRLTNLSDRAKPSQFLADIAENLALRN